MATSLWNVGAWNKANTLHKQRATNAASQLQVAKRSARNPVVDVELIQRERVFHKSAAKTNTMNEGHDNMAVYAAARWFWVRSDWRRWGKLEGSAPLSTARVPRPTCANVQGVGPPARDSGVEDSQWCSVTDHDVIAGAHLEEGTSLMSTYMIGEV
jgi:hypothetical protein